MLTPGAGGLGGLRPWRSVECHNISVGTYQGSGALLLLLRSPQFTTSSSTCTSDTATLQSTLEPPTRAERQTAGSARAYHDQQQPQQFRHLGQEGGGTRSNEEKRFLGLVELALRLDRLPVQAPTPEHEPEPTAGTFDGVPVERLPEKCAPVSLKGAVTAAELRLIEGSDCRVLALRLTLELNQSLDPEGIWVGTGRRVFADAPLSAAAELFETALEVARREGARCGVSGRCLPKWTEYVPQRWYCRELRLAVSGSTVLYAASSMLWACWQL